MSFSNPGYDQHWPPCSLPPSFYFPSPTSQGTFGKLLKPPRTSISLWKIIITWRSCRDGYLRKRTWSTWLGAEPVAEARVAGIVVILVPYTSFLGVLRHFGVWGNVSFLLTTAWISAVSGVAKSWFIPAKAQGQHGGQGRLHVGATIFHSPWIKSVPQFALCCGVEQRLRGTEGGWEFPFAVRGEEFVTGRRSRLTLPSVVCELPFLEAPRWLLQGAGSCHLFTSAEPRWWGLSDVSLTEF